MVLAIYGAGGLGKEIYDTAITSDTEIYKTIIFIDDNEKIREFYNNTVYNFESFKENFKASNCRVIIAVGEPSIRAFLFEKVLKSGYCFTSIIHSSAIISSTSKIDSGTYIGPFSFISSNSNIADNVVIQPHAMIGHDVVVGHSSIISSNVVIAGNCTVGKRTYIALNASIEQKVKIGDDSIIGMASCVNKDIPSDVIAMGYPARVLKKNDEKRVF